MRTENSKKNLVAGIAITLSMTLLGFFTRKIFVDNIGIEYMGLNGLLSNILAAVSLLEGGMGGSIVYNLYKPLAEGDRERIVALVQLYRRIYRFIAGGVLIMGLAIYPFLGTFLKGGEGLQHVSAVFFIFLFNSILPYFTAHKWSIINADQKQWRMAGINLSYQVGMSLGRLAVVWFTGNYILYLVVESLFTVGQAVAVSRKANRLYPFIVTRVKHRVDESTRRAITRNSKALFLHSLGQYMVYSTDNIIISSFVGVAVMGVYSNYVLIETYVRTWMTQVLESFSASVGNLVATESTDRVHAVFRTIFLVNFVVVSIPVIVLANTVSPFVTWWLGADYVLNGATVAVALLNVYLFGMRSSALTFKVKSGIFVQDRFSPLIQGVINLVLSLLFVQWWGLTGVLIGTTLSLLAVGFWQSPRMLYKYTFQRPLGGYFARHGIYTALALVSLAVSWWVCRFFATQSGLWPIVGRGSVSLAVPAAVYWLALRRTNEMTALMNNYVKPTLIKVLERTIRWKRSAS
jgi:O-antigen/teichoic acid export membrane protein